GANDIGDDAVRRAAAAVHADSFVARLPAGYESPVAERGATLSVGQKQLLSFARALAFDPRILVLDEATSSVDTETEILIRDALQVLMAGRTTIAIAHRDRKSTRLNSSHLGISYAVFCLKKPSLSGTHLKKLVNEKALLSTRRNQQVIVISDFVKSL